MAWILNYQPTIHHQHIHTAKGTIDIDLDEEKKEETKERDDFYDFEEVIESTLEKKFAAAVIDSAKTEAVICLLRLLMAGKQKPKDVMMPVRAAMDVGVIRRPTWEEFCSEFGTGVVRSKASFSDYTNPEKFPYDGADFKAMKAQFAKI